MSVPAVSWRRLPDGGCVASVGGEDRAAFSTPEDARDYIERLLARDRVAARVEQIVRGYHRGTMAEVVGEGNGHIDGA